MWTRPIPYIISLFSGTFDLSLTNTSDQIPFTANISFFLSRHILISSKQNIFCLFCAVRYWFVSLLVSHCAVMTGSRQKANMMLFKTVADCFLVLIASWGILSESISICPAIAYHLLNYRAFPVICFNSCLTQKTKVFLVGRCRCHTLTIHEWKEKKPQKTNIYKCNLLFCQAVAL